MAASDWRGCSRFVGSGGLGALLVALIAIFKQINSVAPWQRTLGPPVTLLLLGAATVFCHRSFERSGDVNLLAAGEIFAVISACLSAVVFFLFVA